jgi:hypothetical protein
MNLFDRTPDRRERTAAERERDRLEREARRTGEPALSPPPAPPSFPAQVESTHVFPTAVSPPQSPRSEVGDPVEPSPQPGRRRRGPGRWIPLAVLVAFALALAWFLLSLFQPFHGDGHDAVEVRIPANVGVSKIGDELERRGVVSSGFFFALRTRLGGNSGALKPGLYTLRRDMSYAAAIGALVKGPEAAKTIAVTIPEGRSIRETEARLKLATIPRPRRGAARCSTRGPTVRRARLPASRASCFPRPTRCGSARLCLRWSPSSYRPSSRASPAWTCAPLAARTSTPTTC